MATAAVVLRHTPRRLAHLLSLTRHLLTQPNPNPNPSPKSLTSLISSIKSEPDPDRIATLLESSTHLPRFYHDRPLHQLAVQKLTRLRRPDLIDRLLSSQRSDPKSPNSEGFLTRILTLYSSSNLLDKALQLFDEMPQRTQLSFSALLTVLLNHGKYDLAIEKFHQLPEQIGVEPGLVPYSLYLKALVAKGELATARKVLDEMSESKGLVPDIVCYNAVLKGYLKSGDENGFDEILKEILDRGLEPDSFTYGCRISMFCGKGESSRGEELLSVMSSKGLLPSSGSFTAVIEGFCKEGDVASALRVFKRMKGLKKKNGKVGVAPNAAPYVTLIRSLVEKGEFDLGLEICKESLSRKFAPPFEVVKELVEGLVKNEKVDEARGIVEKLKLTVRGDAAESWKKIESSLAL